MVAMFTERKKPCPFSKTAMEQQKDLNCLGTGSVYHCILDERNRSGEICQQPIWEPKGKVQCVIKKNGVHSRLRIFSFYKFLPCDFIK